MNEEKFPSGITRNSDIVNILKSIPIKRIIRAYNNFDLERIKNSADTLNTSRAFDFLPGAVLLHLKNDDVIGFSGNETLDSIFPWFAMHKGKEVNEVNTWPYVRELSEHMDSTDPVYSDKER